MIQATLGNYGSVQSSPLLLFIDDPCLDTALLNQPIPQQVAILYESAPVTYSVPKFEDSVSKAYSGQFGDGSGSDLCGQQTYMLYEIVNG